VQKELNAKIYPVKSRLLGAGLYNLKHDQIVDAANTAFVSNSVEDVRSIAVSHNFNINASAFVFKWAICK
jgi:hypothetical protein